MLVSVSSVLLFVAHASLLPFAEPVSQEVICSLDCAMLFALEVHPMPSAPSAKVAT
jgi:hypothetical protein